MYQNPVAVIMSVYKAEIPENLIKSLNSLRKQSYKNLHVHIAKDGPLSPELNAAIMAEVDSPGMILKVHEFNKNEGLSIRLNDLLLKIKNKYEYIARMDSDDICINNRIEKQVQFMEEHKEVDVLGGTIFEVDINGNTLQEVNYPSNNEEMKIIFVKRNIMAHVTAMFRVTYFKKAGIYPVTKKPWSNVALPVEDTLMWLEGLTHDCIFANIKDPLVHVMASDGYFKRRTGIRLAIVEYQIRNNIVKRLKLPLIYYIYAFMYLIARLLPTSIKKILWRFR